MTDDRKVYEPAEFEIIMFTERDIITTSTPSSDIRLPAITGSSGFNLY